MSSLSDNFHDRCALPAFSLDTLLGRLYDIDFYINGFKKESENNFSAFVQNLIDLEFENKASLVK